MRFAEEFESIARELSQLAREGRELSYRDGAIGITELISCPKKAELRRQYPDLEIQSVEIDDGFFFEKAVKTVLARKFGDRFEEEKVLPYERGDFLIDGHLDCCIHYDDETVVGLELKHTVLMFDNESLERPEPLIVLQPGSRNIRVNYKYALQARIQKTLLQKMYPDKNVEMYLFIKTSLRTRRRMGKTLIAVPVTKGITEEELDELIRLFREDRRPRAGWECKYCIYKSHGLCEGCDDFREIVTVDNGEEILNLLERRRELLAELKMIEDQLKSLISEPIEINGQKIGWLPKVTYKYNLPLLVDLIRQRGLRAVDYLQVIPAKVKKLEEILGEDIERARTKQVKERGRFVLPK